MSTVVGYLMPNSIYAYISNIYDLDWSGFMAYQPIEGYLMPNSINTYMK